MQCRAGRPHLRRARPVCHPPCTELKDNKDWSSLGPIQWPAHTTHHSTHRCAHHGLNTPCSRHISYKTVHTVTRSHNTYHHYCTTIGSLHDAHGAGALLPHRQTWGSTCPHAHLAGSRSDMRYTCRSVGPATRRPSTTPPAEHPCPPELTATQLPGQCPSSRALVHYTTPNRCQHDAAADY
jgi:hypothetical protein